MCFALEREYMSVCERTCVEQWKRPQYTIFTIYCTFLAHTSFPFAISLHNLSFVFYDYLRDTCGEEGSLLQIIYLYISMLLIVGMRTFEN
jgi:hypothetical protein